MILSRMPKNYIFLMGRLLGTVAYTLLVPYRKIVRRNIAFAFPEWDSNRVRRHARNVFINLSITFFEICYFFLSGKEEILKNIQMKGDPKALKLLNNPKGTILISAHLGNWEMGPLFASCYLQYPLILVARKVRPRLLNKLVDKMRSRFGNTILDKKNALVPIKQSIRDGHVIGLLVDQGTTFAEGVETTFFGHKVTATPVVALLARRYRCPVIPAFCVREADGNLSALFSSPLPLKKSDDFRADLTENTQIMINAIEDAIRKYPDQWFWFHKRWKRFYPWLYPEYQARRRRRKERKGKRKK